MTSINNVDLYERQLATKVDLLEHLEAKPDKGERDLQQIKNLMDEIVGLSERIEKERQRQIKQTEQIIEQEAATEKRAEIERWCRDLIDRNDIRFSGRPGVYLERHGGRWLTFRPDAFREMYSRLQDREIRRVFDDLMESGDRKYKEMTYSFLEKPPYVLNLMSTDDWVVPAHPDTAGDPHPIFDLILRSCGGGTDEGYRHLRECLIWKYLHPHDFMLPTPVMYGHGGAGKNFLFEKVFNTLWPNQSVQLKVENCLGGFNGLMVGRTAIMINEATSDKTDYEAIKALVHSATFSVNEKYGGQYMSDNTPWLWVGCNDLAGAFRMDGGSDGVDRRWSPIEIKKPLVHWVQEHFGFRSYDEAKRWLKENEHVTTNRDEVARWLTHLMLKGIPDYRPDPLHGEAYEDLIETQKTPLDDVMDIIDQRSDITYLIADFLYASYTQYYKSMNPSGRPLGSRKFYKTVEVMLERAGDSGLGARWAMVEARVKQKSVEYRKKVLVRRGKEQKVYDGDMSRFADLAGRSTLVMPSHYRWD